MIDKTGGCQCGKVRYRTKVDPTAAYLCHCRMCQRATGGVSIAFVGVKLADTQWNGEPDWYQSSPNDPSARLAAHRSAFASSKAARTWT